MKLKVMHYLAGVGLLCACVAVHADADAEREQLTIITQEILRLQQYVNQAAKQADTAARVQFRYDFLLSDLELVKDGVNSHLDAPRQPRPIVPLKGDYRR